MEYSAGLTIASYEVGLRLISERRDLRGRLDLAHLAALSLACLAKQTLNKRKRLNIKLELSMRSGEMDEGRNLSHTLEAYVFVSRTPKSCGAKAEADAKRVTRRRIALIMVKSSIMMRGRGCSCCCYRCCCISTIRLPVTVGLTKSGTGPVRLMTVDDG